MIILLMLFILVFLMCFPAWYRQWQWLRWKKNLNVVIHEQPFLNITRPYNGFLISQQARKGRERFEDVYGEIDWLSFVDLMSVVTLKPESVFYDLGSGTGKNVLLCAMVFDIKKSCGVEQFEMLHHAAVAQQQELSGLLAYQQKAAGIYFICGDFLNEHFNDATVVFINSTAYFGDTWVNISKKLETVLTCEVIITTSKKLVSTVYRVTQEKKVQMSWGVVLAYIHERVNFLKQ